MKKFSLLGAIALCALLLAGVAPADPAAAQGAFQAACSGDGVYLYDERNFGGRCIKLTEDEPDLSRPAFNNITSSIRIVGDYTATLYVDQNYGGASSTFSGDDANISDNTIGDNRASSVRVSRGNVPSENICAGDGVYLYDGTNYTGRCIKLTEDEPDLSELAFNNVASSIQIEGDYTAILYVDQNYGGNSTTFTGDDPDLSNNRVGTNSASAVRVLRGNVPSGNACDGGDGVYLYEHPNYQGRCAKFTADAGDLRTIGFDDTASSIRLIGGGWTAILFRDLNGSGISSSFTQDDPNLADNSIGDNQVTSVGVRRSDVPSGNCDGGEGVYLYEHPNYQGRCVKLTSDAGDLRTLGFDDTASSIRILGDWTATLFRDLYGTGIASAFSREDANLADDAIGDNQATSVGVRRGGPIGAGCDGGEGVYLYEHPNYQGRCVKLTGDVGDLRTLGFDDIVSSVRVVGSWATTLFRDLYGTGLSSTYTQSSPNVAGDTIGDNQATSVSVRRR